ncbi:MAG: putative zinc-binding protein [Candidatus Hodarchaeota archaeon]
MINIKPKKVGIISCSGEEIPEGTISRLATLQALRSLRSNETVTLCLPLFLAGSEQERDFAKFYPTIAVDGCEKRCAMRATEKYSAPPRVNIIVSEIIKNENLAQVKSLRNLDKDEKVVVELIAEKIASNVDILLGKESSVLEERIESENISETTVLNSNTVSCSCGLDLPSGKIKFEGNEINIVGLPLIFELFYQKKFQPSPETADAILEKIRLYNPDLKIKKYSFQEIIVKEYEKYLTQEKRSEM